MIHLYIYFPVKAKGCHIFYIGYHVSSDFIMLKLYKWHIFGRKCSQNYKKYFEYTIWSNSRQTKRMQCSLYVWMLPPNLLTPEALCLILYAFISYFICNQKKINESLGHFTTLTDVDIFLSILVELDWLASTYREFNFSRVKILVSTRMWIINIIPVPLRGHIYIIILEEYW